MCQSLRGVFVHSLPARFPHTVPLLLAAFMIYWYFTRYGLENLTDMKIKIVRLLVMRITWRPRLFGPFSLSSVSL